ncbi:MAG: FAD-dependent oxidoreductase, partial [Pseudomonadota bacterium]
MRIAIIGSGIAGLSAAWRLSQDHEVTIFEKFGHLGMDAHSLDVRGEGGNARVDVPMRVFFDGFYPTLTALYR